jgi:hypothetical protein
MKYLRFLGWRWTATDNPERDMNPQHQREGRKSVPETNSAAIKLFTDITKESYCRLEEI